MYPLLLSPVLKSRLWGGEKLTTEYGFQSASDTVGEAWLLTLREAEVNTVKNGDLAGKTLKDAVHLWGPACLGKKAAKSTDFPLLIKLIDARKDLSLQVHPAEKSELWYILDAEQDACILYGFSADMTKERCREHIRKNTLQEVCNRVPVRKGDLLYVPAGTVHAIGHGVLLAEIQQNSDATLRLYDYGRTDENGKLRPLQIEEALKVLTLTVTKAEPILAKTATENRLNPLFSNALFSVSELLLNGAADIRSDDSFLSVTVLEGSVEADAKNTHICAKKGDSLFLPASLPCTLSGRAKLLISSL